MSILGNIVSGPSQSEPPGFNISSVTDAYHRQLNRVGQKQYDAKRQRDHSRVNRLRNQVVEKPAIGAGIGREVYPLPKDAIDDPQYDSYVIKFASPDPRETFGQSRDGRVQNQTEVRVWQKTRCEHLVPVIAADDRGYWVIMPKGDQIKADRNTVKEITEQLAVDCELGSLSADIIEQDIVRLRDNLHVCDYGYDPTHQ